MNYECVVKRLTADEIAIAAQAIQEQPIQVGSVRLEVESAVVDLAQISPSPADEGWKRPNWGSLAGRVIETSQDSADLQPGERISVIGPVERHVVIPARACVRAPGDLSTDETAYWALVTALVRSIRQMRIEIGEAVLVVGDGLCSYFSAQLALRAGASVVVGLGNNHSPVADPDTGTRLPYLSPIWVAEEEAARQVIPSGEADVLLDVSNDLTRLSSVLPLVRESGRALILATGDTALVDFNFYSDIHRRSLAVTGSALSKVNVHQNPSMNETRESQFIQHLLKQTEFNSACRAANRVSLKPTIEQTVATCGLSLIAQWNDPTS